MESRVYLMFHTSREEEHFLFHFCIEWVLRKRDPHDGISDGKERQAGGCLVGTRSEKLHDELVEGSGRYDEALERERAGEKERESIEKLFSLCPLPVLSCR